MRFISLVAAIAALWSSPALAVDWFLAESDHFRVYAEDTAEATEAFARDLERLDQALRITGGFKPDAEPLPEAAKISVFRFGETSDIAALAGKRNSGIAGFFIPRAGGSVAFVPRQSDKARGLGAKQSRFDLDPRAILFHEYTHYFMYQHRAAAYPGWYSEGFAELFGTLEIQPASFVLGQPPVHRGIGIAMLNLDLERMLEPPQKRTGEDQARQYAHGWLLTSYLTFEPSRRGQLGKYLGLVNQGKSSLEAGKESFGDLSRLERELDKYRRSAAHILKVPFASEARPEVSVRRLSQDEQARMMMMIQSKRGVTEEKARKQTSEARALVQRYAQSVPVLVAATEVEFDAGNIDEAERLAELALAMDPKNIGAMLHLAYASMKRAKDDPAHFAIARSRFAAANKAQPKNPAPLYGYYLTFQLSGEEAPENALIGLENAHDYAPFDENVRTTLAHLLLTEGRDESAKVVLGPLLSSSHSRRTKRLREAIEKFQAGERQPLIDELAPTLDEKKDEDENEGNDDDDD